MKLVKQQLYEKFSEDSDPIRDMGIGAKPLILKWIENYKKSSRVYTNKSEFIINDDGTIDVEGNVNLYKIGLKQLPEYIQFNTVSGIFWINQNQLITLKGCPYHVGQHFFCCNNMLTTLEFSPEYVGGKFECSNNKLTSLEFSPKKVVGAFDCTDNLVKFSIKDVLKVCDTNPNYIEC